MPRPACFLIVAVILSASLRAESPKLRFETDVRGILRAHCFQCHGEESEVRANLDLRLVRFMHKGGDSGAAIVPGKPDDSLLYQRLRDGEMPPDESKRISDEELNTIRDWIVSGAETVRDEPDRLGAEGYITEEEKSHWSLQAIRRPAVPEVDDPIRIAADIVPARNDRESLRRSA